MCPALKYNLKHPLWRSYPAHAKYKFEIELRDRLGGNKPYGPSPMTKAFIKEILGE